MSDLGIFQEPPGNGHLPDERFSRRGQRSARKRQRRRAAKGKAAVLFSLAFLVAIVGTGGVIGYAWLDDQLHPPDYSGPGEGQAVLQIQNGEFANSYAKRMAQEKIVKSARAFVKVADSNPQTSSIQPGYYNMRLHMSAKAALALLLDPKSRSANQIVIPEGLRAVKIYEMLAQKTGIPLAQFQEAARDTSALGLPSYANGKIEGYLGPGRFDLKPNSTAKDLLTMMVAQFNKVATSEDLVAKAGQAHLTPAELVTVASLVQAESGNVGDMPKVARVVYNRLRQGMKLQFDSTTLYGLGKFGISASNEDIKSNSPYNTYKFKGLPPGPIDSPSQSAIDAAVNPAAGAWLYFVTTDPSAGKTEFAVTYPDFQRLEAKLNDWRKSHPNGK
jgi:UPF0755 protein